MLIGCAYLCWILPFFQMFLLPYCRTLPLCEAFLALPETQSRGNPTIQSDPSCQGPKLQTGPELPLPVHQSDLGRIAALTQSGGTAAARLTRETTLQGRVNFVSHKADPQIVRAAPTDCFSTFISHLMRCAQRTKHVIRK